MAPREVRLPEGWTVRQARLQGFAVDTCESTLVSCHAGLAAAAMLAARRTAGGSRPPSRKAVVETSGNVTA